MPAAELDTNDYVWWKDSVFYELYIDKFAGDLQGLIKRLDYLSALGVDCLHILPPFPSPMIDDGYDISDHRGIREEFGTLEDFRTFVEAAHARGIRILIDFVLNHVSSEHPWFVEARSSKSNPKRDFFIWSETAEELRHAANMFPHLKASNWIPNPHAGARDYYFTTFYPEQPDLNWNNPEVFEEMMDILNSWIAIGVDAFRFDAAPHAAKKEGTSSEGIPETHALLRRIRAHVESRAPHVVALLAEAAGPVETIKTYFGSETEPECHMAYLFPLAPSIFLGAIRNDYSVVDAVLARAGGIPSGSAWATFLRSHDEMWMKSLTPEEREEIFAYCDPEHRLTFGARHAGISARVSTLLKGDEKKIREVHEVLLSILGAPILYYGDEIGMTNDTTIGAPADTRRYVRGAFDWDEAARQMKDPDSLLSFIAGRIRARKSALARGEVKAVHNVAKDTLCDIQPASEETVSPALP